MTLKVSYRLYAQVASSYLTSLCSVETQTSSRVVDIAEPKTQAWRGICQTGTNVSSSDNAIFRSVCDEP